MSHYYFKKNNTEFKYWLRQIDCYIELLTSGEVEEISLNHVSGITPGKLTDIFDELGYSKEFLDENGWEQDTWYLFSKDDIYIQFYYCGFDFDMVLSLYEGDE